MNKENHLVEYKRELSETFERSVIAFLNSTGGHIYIGINDDGSVYGVKDMDHVQRQIADRILNNVKPNAIGLFEVVAEENRKPLNDQFAKTLELLTPDGKYNYNAYLLADENGVSIKVARLTRLQVANITHARITPMERIEKPLVDPVALREAVINAVVHNDYTKEVPPLFEFFSNRMEITNYGGLVEGLSREDFFNCCSMPRNRELMRIFHDLDMVEQLGSGMRRILRFYDEKAFSFTDHFMRTSFYFEDRLRLDDRINDRISDRIKLTETESLVFAEIKRNPSVTVPLLMRETGYSEPTVNRTLKSLREKSCIVRIGARKNGRWEILESAGNARIGI